MRAATIGAMVFGFLLAVVGLVFGIHAWVVRPGGKLWFFWIAPLLAVGFGGVITQLAFGYWIKVGRLETKGRPRK